MGNSLSLSRDCVGGGQHAADTAAAREPCMEEIHVVGESCRPKGSPSPLAALASAPPEG